MLGARESTTPLIETIILRDDHLTAKSGSNGSLGAGPLPHLDWQLMGVIRRSGAAIGLVKDKALKAVG
jgi:hypothetical protein